jgi:tRNA-Thr(GGU) m(6)t(6)A37 methyltransferase TsaA
MDAELRFIGHIETPYQRLEDCPRNIDPAGPTCTLVVSEPFEDALLGLRRGDLVLILYWLGEADRGRLRQKRRGSDVIKGTFALRTPHRPNPIGAALLPIDAIEGRRLTLRGLDCLDGTPLIDIKPAMMKERREGQTG